MAKSRLRYTKIYAALAEGFEELNKAGLCKSALRMSPTLELTAAMSKQEIREWLGMKPAEMNKLTNKEIYNLLAELLPEMERAQQHLDELAQLFEYLDETALSKRRGKYHAKVLQFNDILVAAVTAPAIRYAEVIAVLKAKYPKLKKTIEKIVAKKTTMATRILKTTQKKLEKGNKEKFPIKKYPPKVMPMKGAMLREAGLMSFFESLYNRSKDTLKAAWEDVKSAFSTLFDSLLQDVDDLNEELDGLTKELGALM